MILDFCARVYGSPDLPPLTEHHRSTQGYNIEGKDQTKEYIFIIEWHYTMFTPIWKK